MTKRIATGAGESHFVTFSTFGRRELLGSGQPRQIVISVLSTLAAKGEVKVSGFVIMPNHVHAVLWFDDDAVLPKTIQTWKRTSAHYLRVFYEQHAPGLIEHLQTRQSGRDVVCFWQRRYYDFNIRTPEKLDEKLTYMHYNPVKKGLAANPEDYIWSSAPWYYRQRSVGVKIEPVF